MTWKLCISQHQTCLDLRIDPLICTIYFVHPWVNEIQVPLCHWNIIAHNPDNHSYIALWSDRQSFNTLKWYSHDIIHTTIVENGINQSKLTWSIWFFSKQSWQNYASSISIEVGSSVVMPSVQAPMCKMSLDPGRDEFFWVFVPCLIVGSVFRNLAMAGGIVTVVFDNMVSEWSTAIFDTWISPPRISRFSN